MCFWVWETNLEMVAEAVIPKFLIVAQLMETDDTVVVDTTNTKHNYIASTVNHSTISVSNLI